jgi:hypothetical protein
MIPPCWHKGKVKVEGLCRSRKVALGMFAGDTAFKPALHYVIGLTITARAVGDVLAAGSRAVAVVPDPQVSWPLLFVLYEK